MRRLLFILITLSLFSNVHSQDLKPINVKPVSTSYYGPTGFWGLTFGESFEETITHVKSRVFNAEIHSQTLKQNTKMALIKDVMFAGNRSSIILLFYKDKLINGSVKIPVEYCVDSKSKYNKIKDDLNKKYGKPRNEKEKYYPPFQKGDGYFATGIQSGKIKVESTWAFYSNHKLAKAINLKIDSDCQIELGYYDMALSKEWSRKSDERNMNDF